MRRLRSTPALRALVRETTLAPSDFILPLFIAEGIDQRQPLEAMPGVSRLPVADAVSEAGEALSLGIPGVILFGIPTSKDSEGSGAWAPDGIVQRAARELKAAHPELLVIADLCLCEYTDHGHCGVVRARRRRSTTMRPWNCSHGPRCRRRGRASTSSRPAT